MPALVRAVVRAGLARHSQVGLPALSIVHMRRQRRTYVAAHHHTPHAAARRRTHDVLKTCSTEVGGIFFGFLV